MFQFVSLVVEKCTNIVSTSGLTACNGNGGAAANNGPALEGVGAGDTCGGASGDSGTGGTSGGGSGRGGGPVLFLAVERKLRAQAIAGLAATPVHEQVGRADAVALFNIPSFQNM